MRHAIFHSCVNPVEHEFEARDAQGRPLFFRSEAAPEKRRPKPVIVVADFALTYAEVCEQDAARAQSAGNWVENDVVLIPGHVKKLVRRDGSVEARGREAKRRNV
jgi:hypothetical protein